MSSLSGKVAIVTGSSRGIGARIATRLAQAGAEVIVNYAGRRDAVEEVVQSIEAGGGRALVVQGDVSKPQDVRALFDAAVERFARVHILVNNAGIILYKRLDQTTDDEFDRLFAVNLIDNPAHVADLRELLRDQGGRRAIDAHLRQGGR